MTGEKAKVKNFNISHFVADNAWLSTFEAIEKAYNAGVSEQEAVLDKIRAEIEEQVLESLSDGGDDWFAAEKVNECLEIIDKYIKEQEK